MEQKKPGQQMRYSDEELEFLNKTFAEKPELLILIRKYLLQGELNEGEKLILEASSPQFLKIMRKTYLPEIDLATPLGQLVDLWSNIDTKNKDVDGAWLEMAARKIMIDFVRERLEALENRSLESEIQFADLGYSKRKSKEDNFIELSARNTIISHIDYQTLQLWVLAGQKIENIVDIQKRLFKDSSR